MTSDDSILIQFALGTLDTDQRKTIERELVTSHKMQVELREIQETLAITALAENPIRPSDDLRGRVLGALDADTQFKGYASRFADLFDLSKASANTLLAKINEISDIDWRSTLIPGVQIMEFTGGPKVASATCGIVQVQAGRIFPAHRHRSDEWVLVLQGQARENSGKLFKAGDISCSQQGSTHSFRIEGKEPFVFAVMLRENNKWLLARTLLDHVFGKKRFTADD